MARPKSRSSAHALRGPLYAATAVLAAMAAPASAAAVIFDVAGPRDDGLTLGPGVRQTGAAASFTLNQAYDDFALFVDFECFSCTGNLYLTQGPLGAGASPLDLRAVTALMTAMPAETFSGLSLGSGTYHIVADVRSGFGIWAASTAPALTGTGGLTDGSDFVMTDLDISLPTRSDFAQVNTVFRYTAFGEMSNAAVPEPSSWALLIAGFAGLGATLRRRRRNIRASIHPA